MSKSLERLDFIPSREVLIVDNPLLAAHHSTDSPESLQTQPPRPKRSSSHRRPVHPPPEPPSSRGGVNGDELKVSHKQAATSHPEVGSEPSTPSDLPSQIGGVPTESVTSSSPKHKPSQPATPGKAKTEPLPALPKADPALVGNESRSHSGHSTGRDPPPLDSSSTHSPSHAKEVSSLEPPSGFTDETSSKAAPGHTAAEDLDAGVEAAVNKDLIKRFTSSVQEEEEMYAIYDINRCHRRPEPFRLPPYMFGNEEVDLRSLGLNLQDGFIEIAEVSF